jgi:hypothetical protein
MRYDFRPIRNVFGTSVSALLRLHSQTMILPEDR